MPNIELHEAHPVSNFRKIAIGTWKTTYDPQVYGTMEVVMDRAVDYMARWRAATGKRLTVSHMMAKAIAAAFARMPDANALLRFNRPYRRKSIGVFFQVVMTDEGEDKVDLSGATLYGVDQLSLGDVVDQFQAKVDAVRQRKDPALEKTRGLFRWLPFLVLNPFLRLVSFLSYTLNLDLRWAGLPRDPFGSVMITNIGSLGLDLAYAPLVPYSRVPMVLAIGAVKAVPVVEDDQVVIRRVMKVNATFDHRFIDGFHAAVMTKVIRAWFGDPERYFGPVVEAPAAATDAARH